MTLRQGITTGTCAAAAAKAAATVLSGGAAPTEVELLLPGGRWIRVPILFVQPPELPPQSAQTAAITAGVRKDAGDDPDVTHGLEVRARVCWDDHADVAFVAGEGVGTVTKPGLQIPPGQPAINPVPRQMITAAIRQVTTRGVRVEIGIPGGREMAARTFNPRLGIEGGLSILGTTGIVRPYCLGALRDALKCSLDVAAACGVANPVLVPGNIGARAARRHFSLGDEQVVEVGNEWGFVLDRLGDYAFQALLLVGHPGKLAKLAEGEWDTHSARSSPPVHGLARLCQKVLGQAALPSPTTEGLFAALAEGERQRLGAVLAQDIGAAVSARITGRQTPGGFSGGLRVAVFLVDMREQPLGSDGDLTPWQ